MPLNKKLTAAVTAGLVVVASGLVLPRLIHPSPPASVRTISSAKPDAMPLPSGLKVWNTVSPAALAEMISDAGMVRQSEFTSLKLQDGQLLTTRTEQGLPYQQYELDVPAGSSQPSVSWTGRGSRLPELYAWNYAESHWEMMQPVYSRSDEWLTLTASVRNTACISNGKIRVLAGLQSTPALIPGNVPQRKDYDDSWAWISDTQYYSASYPQIYDQMAQYLVSKKNDENIRYLIHTGDVVDNADSANQWKNADHSMAILDRGGIPYGVLAGNHDVAHGNIDYKDFWKYFGAQRVQNNGVFAGSPNNNKDHYDLISSGGRQFILIYLGWQPDETSFTWAGDLLKKHAGATALLLTHGYMSSRGSYVAGAQDIYNRLVVPQQNVAAVLCGHMWGAYNATRQIGDRRVFELLYDTQAADEGGSGYIRFFRLDARNGLIYMQTYSPYKNAANVFGADKDQLIIPLPQQDKDAYLSTDAITVR